MNSTFEYSQQVATGFPSPATDYLQDRVDFNKLFIRHPLSTFFMVCEGTSMVNAFIPPKAILLVDRSLQAKNMDIVVAIVNGEFTVRRLIKNERKCFLRAENSKYREVEVTPDIQMEIWGVVTHIVTDTTTLK